MGMIATISLISSFRCAIDGGHVDVIKLLVDCGAHLQMGSQELGEVLCFHARAGDVNKLRCFALAGASMEAKNATGNTPLHSATETGQAETAAFLLTHGVKVNAVNAYGQTAAAVAVVMRRTSIAEMLKRADNSLI